MTVKMLSAIAKRDPMSDVLGLKAVFKSQRLLPQGCMARRKKQETSVSTIQSTSPVNEAGAG